MNNRYELNKNRYRLITIPVLLFLSSLFSALSKVIFFT